ncbi:LexA family transcriptional regulator [Sphingobium aromaticiconvertens]|uniref:LexA family transcriptional regulator n=1 Tax=Sphingobium aromaticiconvertens TaxID=365341 RepID=UPI0030197EFD
MLVEKLGTQKQAAERTGIPYATLQRMIAGKSPITAERVGKIVRAEGLTEQDIQAAENARTAVFDGLSRKMTQRIMDERSVDVRDVGLTEASRSGMMDIPALATKAAAGDGSFMWGEEMGHAPFQFAEDWLRRSFGNINGLRMIQISGDSQLPDLSDGDWVAIDTAKNKLENGLAVIRLDDCLMIKRLQREGHFLQLMSRNPIYGPIVIDLSKEQERIQVIGKSVFTFKAV